MRRIILVFLVLLTLFSSLRAQLLKPFNKRKVYVSENKVSLYEEPDRNSRELLRLDILDFVYILENTNLARQGVREEWYYIDSVKSKGYEGNTSRIKGWIERKFIIGESDFKPVNKISKMFIVVSYPEFGVEYHIESNGIVKERFMEKESKIVISKLFACKNILSLDHREFFYYDEKGFLNSRFANEIKVITNQDKFPSWINEAGHCLIPNMYYFISSNKVNIYKVPEVNGQAVINLKKGTRVKLERVLLETIKNRTGHWAFVDTGIKDKNGDTIKGWVLDVYLKEEFSRIDSSEKGNPETTKYSILTGDNVNVRAEATTNSKVLLQLKKGARVKVLEWSDIEFTVGDKTGYWVYIDTGVKDKKGKTIKGWIVDIYLKPEE